MDGKSTFLDKLLVTSFKGAGMSSGKQDDSAQSLDRPKRKQKVWRRVGEEEMVNSLDSFGEVTAEIVSGFEGTAAALAVWCGAGVESKALSSSESGDARHCIELRVGCWALGAKWEEAGKCRGEVLEAREGSKDPIL